jgi:hypothetical protein
MHKLTWALLAAALVLPVSAQAERIVSGESNGLKWQARNRLVGVSSTATIAGGGNPIYLPQMPRRSGVVALIMDYGPGGSFICSGSLMPDRRHILTAAHCVADGATTGRPLSTTAWFYGGPDPDTIVPRNAASTSRSVSAIMVNPNYTGEVIDQNDIAVLRLGDVAPEFARSYELDFTPGLSGRNFTVAGYGARSDTGGTVGANLGTGRLREGENRFDFRFGDTDFDGFWTDVTGGENFFGTAAIDFSYLSDFDSGLGVNDASCRIGGVFGLGGPKYCDLGRLREVAVAGGDSGGPQFGFDDRIFAVTSYGLSFDTDFGDFDEDLNSSFGEFSGFVPLYIHADFIAAAIPEPASWAMMIAGFGLIGSRVRSRRTRVTYA